MRILITNDDGVTSPGLHALVAAFAAGNGLLVVAPTSDRSGLSHSITAHDPITIERLRDTTVPSYACSGTPADCVFLGVTELMPQPDLVISGINNGPNLADDVNYSGTVAGAIEASLLGVPALAVSLASDDFSAGAPRRWAQSAEIARRCVEAYLNAMRDAAYYWNLNIPNLELSEIRGITLTHLGRKQICRRMTGEKHNGELRYYRAWASPFEPECQTPGSDIAAVYGGYASLTPLLVDRTAHAMLVSLAPETAAQGGSLR